MKTKITRKKSYLTSILGFFASASISSAALLTTKKNIERY